MKRGSRTIKIADNFDVTTSYQDINVSDYLDQSIISEGGQVVLTFKRTGGTSLTFKLAEQFSDSTGYIPRTEDDGSDLTLIERTSAEASFSYAFTTLAQDLRVSIKGASGDEALEAYITVGEVA